MNDPRMKRGLWMIAIIGIVIIILQSLIIWTNITGYTIYDFGNYSSEIDLNYTSNSSYLWSPSEEGILTSLKLSGYIAGDSASVYLEDDMIYSYNPSGSSAISVANGSGEIEIDFGYGDGTDYDNNNDGISFIDDVIDFSVNASFDFNHNESYLCTKYVVNNLDDNLSYPVCYGGIECCDFLNLESLGNWSDDLLLNYGKYSSGYNNTVSAQVIYYDVDLSVPYSNIYNSEALRLNANFVDSVYFSLECVDTCLGLNYSNSSYPLDIVVDGLLYLSNVSYSLGNETSDNATNESESFGDAGASSTPGDIATCQDLDTSGTYTLTGDITSISGTCFNITSDSVVLDFQGFNITGDDSGNDYGVYVDGYNYTTIKNGEIYDFEEGIYWRNNSYNVIDNMSLISNADGGIWISGSSNNNITNINSSLNSLFGIYLSSGSNNTFENITIDDISFTAGFYMRECSSNTLRNINISNSPDGLFISSCSNNQIINNRINSNTNRGIYLESSADNNTFLNNNIYGNPGMEISASSLVNNSVIYNNSFGEIKWSSDNLTTNNSLTWPDGTISIGNNSAYYNPLGSASVNDRLNSSANITLELTGWSFTNPQIEKDGVNCTDCYNFTSLSATTVVFNVSSFSNYSIGESTVVDTTTPNSTNYVYNDTTPQFGEVIEFNASFVDETNMSQWIFSHNLSGSFVNETASSTWISTGGYNVSQYNLTINLTRNQTVGWAFWGNDTNGNWNYTLVQIFVVNNTAPENNLSLPNQAWTTNTNNTYAFDLDNYFNDTDSDVLNYSYTNVTNISVEVAGNNSISFIPGTGFFGTKYIVFYANDSENITNSNNVSLKVYYCGDGTCDAGYEACDACVADCGTCPGTGGGCTNSCSSLGYDCGTYIICGVSENCGSCGTTDCSAAHTTGSCDNTCSSGSCDDCPPSCSCESGWNDCNSDMSDGCETEGSCEPEGCLTDSDCNDFNSCTTNTCEGNQCQTSDYDGTCGSSSSDCYGNIVSCPKECAFGSCNDCTPTCEDPCDTLDCTISETCWDDSVVECSSCSEGSCQSCTVQCPGEPEKEISPDYDDYEKAKFACMNITRSVETNQLSTKKVNFDERLVPEGYSVVMDPFNMQCSGEDVDFTVAIPDNFVDVQILKCAGRDCSAKETKIVTELWCKGEFVEEVKEETRLLSPDLITVKIEPVKVDISELKQSIESGNNKIKFSEEFKGLVSLSMPTTVIQEAENPYLKIIGSPVVLEFEDKVKTGIETDITIPYLVTETYDEESLAIYAKVDDGWAYIDSNIDKQNGLVYANVANIAEFIQDGKATFALMGILRSADFESKLENVYSPEKGTKDLMILVHGTASSPKTFQGIIDDISFAEQNIALYTFRYSLSNSIDEISNEFSNLLETRTKEFDNIHIIAHSAGGIITQQALRNSFDQNYDYIDKVDKVILIATPNEGSPVAEVYKGLFNDLINEKSDNPLFSINSQSIKDLIEGRIIPRVDSVEYYVIAGTKEYETKLSFFDKTGQAIVWDGVVTTESARHIGESYITNKCENYWEIHLTHNDLIADPLARKVIENIIAEDILETDSLLGSSNYYELNIDNCDSAETYVVIGKEIRIGEVEDASLCSCGNGYCGEGEDAFNCPEDCAFFLADVKGNGVLIFGYILLIFFMLFLVITGVKHVKAMHHVKKKSNKAREIVMFDEKIKLIEKCMDKKEIAKGINVLGKIKKRLVILHYALPKKEFKKIKLRFKKASTSVRKVKKKNKDLYYDQLEVETRERRVTKKRVSVTKDKKRIKDHVKKRVCTTKNVVNVEKLKLFFELPHLGRFFKFRHASRKTVKRNTRKVISLKKLKLSFELPRLEMFFRFRRASRKTIERNIRFLNAKIKKYEEEVTYSSKRNAYLVKIFVMYSKIYSKLIYSKIDDKLVLNKDLKRIYKKLKELQKEKPKPLLKEKLSVFKPLKVDIEHASADDIRKRVQKITSSVKKYEEGLIKEKRFDGNYSIKLFKKYSDLYSKISVSDLIDKDSLIMPLKKTFEKIKSIQKSSLDKIVPRAPKSLKKYKLNSFKERRELIKRYKVLRRKINGRLKIGEQFKLFMEYSRLYSDLADSSIEGDSRAKMYDKLEELNVKLKKFGENGKN